MSGRLFLCVTLLILLPDSLAGASDRAGSSLPDAEPAWWLLILFTMNGCVIWFFTRRRYFVRSHGKLKPAFSELQEFSAYLLSGALAAQLWGNGDPESYEATIHAAIFNVPQLGIEATLHFLVNDVFMVLFFGIAAKELCEATMKEDGALRGLNGVIPVVACAGGILGPAIVYRSVCSPELAHAWAVPCATDIAFAWLGARLIWGRTHAAVTFLLAIALADDFVGMCIIAFCFSQHPFDASGILIVVCAMILARYCNVAARKRPFFRRWEVYLMLGMVCWIGLLIAGLHTALALVFIVPFMPMSGRDRGIFGEKGRYQTDTVNRFEHATKGFVDTGLFFFGLVNAGVTWWDRSVWDRDSWAVFLGLGLGKTLGIVSFTVLAWIVIWFRRRHAGPPGNIPTELILNWRQLPIVGLLGAMGFTVSLFVADAAGGHQSLKLGALASFAYLGLAVFLGRISNRTGAPPSEALK